MDVDSAGRDDCEHISEVEWKPLWIVAVDGVDAGHVLVLRPRLDLLAGYRSRRAICAHMQLYANHLSSSEGRLNGRAYSA